MLPNTNYGQVVVNPDRESCGAASIATPKEQPPRNLSGKRTGRVRQRWKIVVFARHTEGESSTVC
jgi:hypothetical protein